MSLCALLLLAFVSVAIVMQNANVGNPSGVTGTSPQRQTPVAERPEASPSKNVTLLSASRDVTQTAFFIVVGVVTILTYKKARLTLLQPLRTEVFKQQLQAFADVLAAVRYPELELREQFAFRRLIELNIVAMYDAYAFRFFDVETQVEQRSYNFAECPESILIAHPDGGYPDLIKDEDHIRRDKIKAEKADPNARAAIWVRYRYDNIRLPKQLVAKLAEIRKIADSPLITKELAKLISDLDEAVRENIVSVSTILAEVAREMPEKYQNLDVLQKASFGWILNRYYNESFVDLGPKSEAIAEYMRDYFKVEDLLT